jgi:hypothetical protein
MTIFQLSGYSEFPARSRSERVPVSFLWVGYFMTKVCRTSRNDILESLWCTYMHRTHIRSKIPCFWWHFSLERPIWARTSPVLDCTPSSSIVAIQIADHISSATAILSVKLAKRNRTAISAISALTESEKAAETRGISL